MPTIRIPYPTDPEGRSKAYRRLSSAGARFGTVEGTPEAGKFQGSTPIGSYSGSYSCPEGSSELVVVIDKKPLLVGIGRIESELQKLLNV